MAKEPAQIVLTGSPGCGKTTAVTRIAQSFDASKLAGFWTEEIREAGIRRGFRWNRPDGSAGILAHVNIKSPHRVGKYGVDIATFNQVVVPTLDPEQTAAELFIIDEIGKMECFSKAFVATVRKLFNSERCVLATVALKGSGLIEEAKHWPGIELHHLTVRNRDSVVREITQRLAFLQ